MDAVHNGHRALADRAREFLWRLWQLENEERPGFLIGDLGGPAIGGTPVRSALFSTEGAQTVRERLQDPEQFLQAQLEEIESQAALRGDLVPALCPAIGVVGIPSAFGCKVVWWERDFPAVRACVGDDPMAVYHLPSPGVTDGELGRILRYTRYFVERTEGSFPIRLSDVQGPLDAAALILGHNNLLTAFHTNPDEVRFLLERVTDLTIAFIRAQRQEVRTRQVEFVPSLFQPWMPDGFGVSLSNDECVMISPELHDEFVVPCLNRISHAFGGLYIHSCGNWTHQFSSLEKVHALRGVEFGASETPYGPVLERFGGRIVVACRIGLHRDITFRGMADFIRCLRRASPTNRGLFIHVDITNGIPGDRWPVTDLQEVYALLDAGGKPA